MKLFGRHAVIERLKSNPKSIRKIYLEEGQADSSYIRKTAQQWSIPVLSVPRSKMIKIGRNARVQGIIIEVDDFQYVPYDDLLVMAREKKLSLIFLDNLNDPQNLGSIIRSAACFGNFSIVLPTHGSVGVTEAVLRVASGGDNHLSISRVTNISQAITKAKKEGFWIAGTVVSGGQDLKQAQLSFPLALVIGSEQKGIRDIVKKQLDMELTIPMAHPRLSLNVAQAVTAFCYEITKQKNSSA